MAKIKKDLRVLFLYPYLSSSSNKLYNNVYYFLIGVEMKLFNVTITITKDQLVSAAAFVGGLILGYVIYYFDK